MSVDRETGLTLARQVVAEIGPRLNIREWHMGGSCAIAGSGRDVDIIILQDKEVELDAFTWLLDEHGFLLCGEESYDGAGMFVALRRGDVNLIIVENAEYYRSWEKAQAVSRWLHNCGFEGRPYRVFVHRLVRDGELWPYRPLN